MPPPPPSPWPHYAWAAGHVVLLICAARYLVGVVTFRAGPLSMWYKASYAGALISYSIVCYKALGTPQASAAYFQRAIMDENVQYFILSLYWFLTRPVWPTLIPFATFSLFHTLTFTRTNIIGKIFPPKPPAAPAVAGAPPPRAEAHPAAKMIGTWVKRNYETAMNAVAHVELGIFGWVLIGAFLRRNSLLTPIIYAHFLRQRYYFSGFTREAIKSYTAWVDVRVDAPNVPPMVKNAWAFVKAAAQRWGGGPVASHQGAAPQAEQARARR